MVMVQVGNTYMEHAEFVAQALRTRVPQAVEAIVAYVRGDVQDFAAFERAVAVMRKPKWLAQLLDTSHRNTVLRDAHRACLEQAPKPSASGGRSGPRARIQCHRCGLLLASMPPDHQGRERIRLHSCPHGWRCVEKERQMDLSKMSPERAQRMREVDAQLRERYPKLHRGPCHQCAAARAAVLSTPATVQRTSTGSVAMVMSRRAANAMPGLRLGEVRPAGGDLVSVVVPEHAADHLVTGQRLVRVVRGRARRAPAVVDEKPNGQAQSAS